MTLYSNRYFLYLFVVTLIGCGSSVSSRVTDSNVEHSSGSVSGELEGSNNSDGVDGAIHNSDSVVKARKYKVKVIASLPHDPQAYTQGLLIDGGKFYESTGEYGNSSVRRVNISSAKVEKKVTLPPNFFGEGLALLDGKLYQLSWMEGVCFVYDLASFKQLKKFSYDGQGWGITTDGKHLYTTDGSYRIFVRDPNTFAILRTINVRNHAGYIHYLNELEWIDGKIWANVYMDDKIVIINPVSGILEGVVDCSQLKGLTGNSSDSDVLNGIALDRVNGNIYVTGKLWDRVFQITLEEL